MPRKLPPRQMFCATETAASPVVLDPVKSTVAPTKLDAIPVTL